jgi:hypothetical protein
MEVLGQEGLHLGEPVEPDDEANLGFTVAKASMEFFDDMGREAANFAIAFHTLLFFFCCAAKALAGDRFTIIGAF